MKKDRIQNLTDSFEDHFLGIGKMVTIGSVTQREIKGISL
jgi:hypothetical protein